jgi:hypothetical protein
VADVREVAMNEVDWQAVEAVGTWAGVVLLVFAALVALLYEFPEARRTRHAQAAMDIFRQLRSQEQKESLKAIENLQTEDIPPEMEADIGRVLDGLELLGAMVAAGQVDEDVALRLVRGAPLMCWYKLRGYIGKQRERGGHYARHMEYYAHLSLKHQYEEVPEGEWTRLNGLNLVHELKEELLPKQKPPK